MSFQFVDRESAYPNRYLVTPESGTPYHAILTRADEPVVVGTPLNAETFNTLIAGMQEAGGTVSEIDLSNFEKGSFTEVVDGETVSHAVAYDDKGRPVSIDGVSIEWGDSDVGPVESTEYPGCSYRTVDGEKEWINPPMIAGEAYRTQERHNGKAVYAACVRHEKAIGSNGTTTVHQQTLMLAAAPHIVSLSGVVSNAYGEAYPSSRYGDLKASYYEGELCIDYNVTEAMPESTVDIIVKFTLD